MIDPAAYSLTYDVPLCESLAQAGLEVTLYTTRFTHGPMPKARGFAIEEWFYRRHVPGIPRRFSRGLQHPLDTWRLARHLRRTRPDVVHVQWSVLDRIDVPAWTSIGVPAVFTAHNSVGRASEALDCAALRRFDAVVAHSQFGADGLRDQCGLSDVWQVPMGSYEQAHDLPDPDVLPVKLGDGPVVALTGLLRPYKGIDTLLAAWPGVREQVPGAQLLLAGRPLGVDLPTPPPAGVHIVPRFLTDSEFAWALRRADIVCLPYTSIDLSGVLFSAIALGRPLLLSDVGGFGEFVGQGAELVPPANPAALEAKLVSMLRDPALLARLGEQARTAARELYAWESIGRQYAERYARLFES